ncbi:Thiamine-monophosphate kinase [hydrothermal vent metagenome]|uniref:Thiamine-monophosphate kinase n=1 Tax=hydrothermal vent metagenome TaxID=652676 RepID=A0A3B0V8W5_9ZZZZ
MVSERQLIDYIKGAAGKVPERVEGIGDDCAVFGCREGCKQLVSVDTLVEGVHFDLTWHGPRELGHKAAAVNISDIAAMGGKPCFALLSMALPARLDFAWLTAFTEGFTAELKEYGVVLVGGDTVASPAGLLLSVTIIGEAEEGRILYRSGAGVDDVIMVSGSLGDAALGLKLCREGRQASWPQLTAAHLTPRPEVALGRHLAAAGSGVTAMLDMSDGLATDLAHMCAASGLGARINADWLPISVSARQAALDLEIDVLDSALGGGEDYRLLFTCPAAAEEDLRREVKAVLKRQIFRIGKMIPGCGVLLCGRDGERDVSFQGYEHLTR